MSLLRGLIIIMAAMLSACFSQSPTIDSLPDKPVKLQNAKPSPVVSREDAIKHYRAFLKMAPGSPLYSQAMLRVAELELLNGEEITLSGNAGKQRQAKKHIKESIRLYNLYLKTYPTDNKNDQVVYQLAKAYELLGNTNQTLKLLSKLTKRYPNSAYFDEASFRMGEILFVQQRYADAEKAFYPIGSHSKSAYYEKALYKYAWTLFKQNRYKPALYAFFKFLDEKQQAGRFFAKGIPDHVSRAEKEIIEDVFRAICLTVTYMDGYKTLNKFLSRHLAQQYAPLLYDRLGKLYLDKKRNIDAAETFLAYVEQHPTHFLAPEFHEQAINAFQQAGLTDMVLSTKEDFVKRYGSYSQFWMIQHESARQKLRPMLIRHIHDLATHYHVLARSKNKQDNFSKAAYWYNYYLTAFPDATDAAKINFFLAEALNESHRYQDAITEFEKTAYTYPRHEKSAEAAYAALLIYSTQEQKLGANNKAAWKQKEIASALRFSQHFPEDKRVANVLTNTAQELFAQNDYPRTKTTAQLLVTKLNKSHSKTLHRTAWVVLGHANFETSDYVEAEKAYRKALRFISKKNKQHRDIGDRLAASIYKQGEMQRAQGDLELAVYHFLRIKSIAPASKIRVTAEYDAAALLIKAKNWPQAQSVLEDMRRRYSKQPKLQTGITEKLAYIFSQSGQPLKAAKEMEQLATGGDTQYRRNMLLQAAELYQKNNDHDNTARLYKKYLGLYPQPLEPAMEARHYLAEHYRKKGPQKTKRYWLREIVNTDKNAGKARTARSRYLAAHATLQLAQPLQQTYRHSKLTVPLKKSLAKKKRLMKKTLKAYQNAIDYQIADVTTSATYEVAEIYHHFARSILESQRPKNLSVDELEQYDILLEEQAYPFEEKAIAIHQANLKQIPQGIYDQWVQRSLSQLQKLQPIRYAKMERLDNYVDNLY